MSVDETEQEAEVLVRRVLENESKSTLVLSVFLRLQCHGVKMCMRGEIKKKRKKERERERVCVSE